LSESGGVRALCTWGNDPEVSTTLPTALIITSTSTIGCTITIIVNIAAATTITAIKLLLCGATELLIVLVIKMAHGFVEMCGACTS
jgi:hypothetical protein